MTFPPGTRLGPYEIVSPLGAGGMGEVYKARDTRLDRTVAIKVLPPQVAVGEDGRQRFEREARTISQLNHPNICVLHDVGHQDGVDYLVMELLDGETLAARLARGGVTTERALAIAMAVCEALDRAHQQGIVHRDIKPGNIMLTRAGVKLLDFGLARQAPVALGTADTIIASGPAPARPLTIEGSIIGTVQYMSPEQVEGRSADARSDIWAVGCLLYEMLTGTPAFSGASPASLIAAILEREPPPLTVSGKGVTPALERVVRTCIEKDPGDRWQSARDLLRELRWVAEDSRIGVRSPDSVAPASAGRGTRRWALLGLVAFAAAVLIAGVAWVARARGAAASSGPPVVVLMDSTHPIRVYDDETRKAGGTNADDLTDLLRDLPVLLLKENTGLNWHREDEVLRQKPELILVHRSCFFDQTFFESEEQSLRLAPLAFDKLDMFMAYVGVGHPRTRFLVYSRRGWASREAARAWVQSVEGRFPVLRGRVRAWPVPLDRPTFRNPETGAEIRREVVALLGLDRH